MSAWILVSVLFAATSARAADDDDPFEEDEDDVPAPVPTGPADDLGRKDPDDIPDVPAPVPGAPTAPMVPIEDEEELGPVVGGDTAADYRAALEAAKGMGTDEEMAFWEDYLARFPNTQFNTQVRERIDQLMDEMYNRRIERGGTVDAMDQEVRIAQGLLIENLNPRTRLQAGLEWGNPDWINLQVDYEHAFARTFSVHGGIRHRYTGWGLDLGPRWAFVKSTRTQSVVSLLGDIHFNTNPAFVSFRPQLAAGKRFGPVDLQIQGGTDLELRSGVELRLLGGANVMWRASDTFGLFLETSSLMKSLSWEGDMFRFNTISLGMKFFPLSGENQEKLDINIAGTAPYSQSYWQYHFGGVDAQVNYWVDE
jgi:hypothetical protein